MLRNLFSRSFALNISIPTAIALALITLIALDLRVQSVLQTEVDRPLRVDAKDYVLYAYNLHRFGIYSRSNVGFVEDKVPEPDATRTPGYPLFLALFLDTHPHKQDIQNVQLSQALLSVATVLLTFAIARAFLPIALALIATFLTAISPHLVTMNVFILTETLFGFLLVLMCWVIARDNPEQTRKHLTINLLVGVVLGFATLTRPNAQYFVIFLAGLLMWQFGWRRSKRAVAALVLGFALVFGPWIGRNLYTLGQIGDPTLMVNSIYNGAYPNFVYKADDPKVGYPYVFDPRAAEISKNLSSVTAEIARRFDEEPGKHLRWYLVGKPLALWSWDRFEGLEDIFIYPVFTSPYDYLPQFKFTRYLMQVTHGVVVVLMAIGALLVWLPPRLTGIPGGVLFLVRTIALLLIYHTVLLMVGFPLPRYVTPLRPFMYITAMIPVLFVMTQMQQPWWHELKKKVVRQRT